MADLRRLPITIHAVEKFIKRASRFHPPGTDLSKILQGILGSAKKTSINLGHYKIRLQKHGDTEFYTTECGWRIVVGYDSDEFRSVIRTIERIKREQN